MGNSENASGNIDFSYSASSGWTLDTLTCDMIGPDWEVAASGNPVSTTVDKVGTYWIMVGAKANVGVVYSDYDGYWNGEPLDVRGFQVDGKCTSCSSITTSTGSNVIEPAFGDTVTITTYSPLCVDGASVVILRSNPTGGYTRVDTVPMTWQLSSLQGSTIINRYERYLGTAVWPAAGTSMSQCQAGTYRIGFEDSYGNLLVMDRYNDPSFSVNPSVYDVYTNGPSYQGMGYGSGTNTIHYTLSSDVTSCTVSVAGKSITGTTHAGNNTVAWDGKDGSGQPVGANLFPISISTVPAHGANLQLSASSATSFNPASGPLPISCSLYKPNSTTVVYQGHLYVTVYDSRYQIVKYIDRNLADAGSTVSWDGTDLSGASVAPGDYKISLIGKDNAGVGRESNVVIKTVTVTESPQSEAKLDWPSEELSSYDEEGLNTVLGSENVKHSETAPVFN